MGEAAVAEAGVVVDAAVLETLVASILLLRSCLCRVELLVALLVC